MKVLSSSRIEMYVIPWLSIGSRGKTDEVPTLEIIQAMVYRVKTGCQWRFLPVKEFITNKSYIGVYHHYRQWIADGSWRVAFVALLKEHPRVIDLSSAQLDASHTPAKRGECHRNDDCRRVSRAKTVHNNDYRCCER